MVFAPFHDQLQAGFAFNGIFFYAARCGQRPDVGSREPDLRTLAADFWLVIFAGRSSGVTAQKVESVAESFHAGRVTHLIGRVLHYNVWLATRHELF